MKHFLEKYEKVPVREYTNNVAENPVVSVCLTTYNHVDFIKASLEGILMQHTKFPFEILVGEDESSDGTREICLEYAQKYPDKIRLFLHSRRNNIIVNGLPTPQFNVLYNLLSAKGKYIALCAGDDVWTDRYKLQKQVDFLEEHPDFGMISTDITIINEEGKLQEANNTVLKYREARKQEPSFYDLWNIHMVNATTACIRTRLMKNLVNRIIDENIWFFEDIWFWLNIALSSKIKIIYEQTAAYRIHSNNITKRGNKYWALPMVLIKYDAIKQYLKRKDRKTIKKNRVEISKMGMSLLTNKQLPLRKKLFIFLLLLKKFYLFYTICNMVSSKLLDKLIIGPKIKFSGIMRNIQVKFSK